MLRACASARAVAMPIRSPVNVPGPTPTAIRSTIVPADPGAVQDARPTAASGAWRVPGRRPPADRRARHTTTSPSAAQGDGGGAGGGVEGQDPHGDCSGVRSRSALTGASIRTTRRSPPACSMTTSPRCAPSNAIVATAPRATPQTRSIRAEVVGRAGRDPRPRGRRCGRGRGGRRAPLPLVALADRERGAGHHGVHSERAARAPHERRLSCAKLALDQDHIARRQRGGQPRAERLGLRLADRLVVLRHLR